MKNKPELKDQARSYMPGGTYLTTSLNKNSQPEYLFSHGLGAYLYTTEGKKLLDVKLGHGTLLLGHCPPAVVRAVKQQVELGTTFSHVTEPSIQLARMIVEHVPCAEKVRFFNSGTEAILLSLRLIRAFTGKEKILKFEGAYHGFSDDLLFSTNYGNSKNFPQNYSPVPDTPGIPKSHRDLVLVAPYNDADAMRSIIESHHEEIAGIFVEPVMRGIASHPGFLENVREIASIYKIPLIFDEVITGFRLAIGGAQQYYGITPDLAVFGKAVGSGYPIGILAGKDDLMNLLDPATPDINRVFSIGSFHGNALSTTAALANLKELAKPGTYAYLNSYGNHLREELSNVFKKHDIPTKMDGIGSIVDWFHTEDTITDYRSTIRTNLKLKSQLGNTLLKHDIFAGPGRFTSTTSHGDTEMQMTIDAMDKSLSELEKLGELN